MCLTFTHLVLVSFHLEKARQTVVVFTVGVLTLKEIVIMTKARSFVEKVKSSSLYLGFMSKRIVVLSPAFYMKGLSFSSYISDFSLLKHCLHQ